MAARPHAGSSLTSSYIIIRYLVLGLARAAPIQLFDENEDTGKPADDPTKWVYLGTAVALVLLGGVFAGLTIALMGQDEIYLQVIATSGEKHERRSASKVLRLLKRGKHWVLVTLLLSNVITNETLPIVLDRSLGGGWPAVLSSTVLIVIFGEIAPQSVCVRYGLPIGAWMSPFVIALMFIMAPVAWPTARLLDWILGEDHGTTYKKSGLKTLVTLHKSIGPTPSDRLNEDEVTIIRAVLDLKEKTVGQIMTPMNDCFCLSADDVLDEDVMTQLSRNGYSRIPVHRPENKNDFVGMLLVKMLITYDPEDALRVRDFALATLPETRPDTSCLDIINFFQEGKSHMVLVSDFPGEPVGALGLVTLEDVIEELIGEEIVDESDVFVDVHKAIRRLHPSPRARVPKGEFVDGDKDNLPVPEAGALQRANTSDIMPRKSSLGRLGESPKPVTFMMRRRSDGNTQDLQATAVRSDGSDIRNHLKHLGPSNAASNPKSTRISSVKIKPHDPRSNGPRSENETTILIPKAPQGGVGAGLLDAGRDAKDGVLALQQGYGTMSTSLPDKPDALFTVPEAPKQEAAESSSKPSNSNKMVVQVQPPEAEDKVEATDGHKNTHSYERSPNRQAGARSGSLTENMIDIGGVKKLILETTSSSEEDGAGVVLGSPENSGQNEAGATAEDPNGETATSPSPEEGKSNKKIRRKRGGKKNKRKGSKGGENSGDGENAPLLGQSGSQG